MKVNTKDAHWLAIISMFSSSSSASLFYNSCSSPDVPRKRPRVASPSFGSPAAPFSRDYLHSFEPDLRLAHLRELGMPLDVSRRHYTVPHCTSLTRQRISELSSPASSPSSLHFTDRLDPHDAKSPGVILDAPGLGGPLSCLIGIPVDGSRRF